MLKKDFRFRENRSQTSNLYTLTPFLTSGDYYFTVRQDIFELGLKSKEVIVYSYLCSAVNQNNECYPSIKVIAEACDLSETTVKGTIKELINKNLIEKVSQYRSDGGKKNNLYKIIQENALSNDDSIGELVINKGQVTNTENFIQEECNKINEQPKHSENIQEKANIVKHENGIIMLLNNRNNKKIQKEIRRMKIRNDIFNFMLSENSFMLHLYINSCNNINKPYVLSINELSNKLKIPGANIKASLAELQVKELIQRSNSAYPKDILSTPSWVKKYIHN